MRACGYSSPPRATVGGGHVKGGILRGHVKGGMLRGYTKGGMLGGAYSCAACLSPLTIDHASLSRRSGKGGEGYSHFRCGV